MPRTSDNEDLGVGPLMGVGVLMWQINLKKCLNRMYLSPNTPLVPCRFQEIAMS